MRGETPDRETAFGGWKPLAHPQSLAFDLRLRFDIAGLGEINTCEFWDSWRSALRWVVGRGRTSLDR
jgi:hypothetical protein